MGDDPTVLVAMAAKGSALQLLCPPPSDADAQARLATLAAAGVQIRTLSTPLCACQDPHYGADSLLRIAKLVLRFLARQPRNGRTGLRRGSHGLAHMVSALVGPSHAVDAPSGLSRLPRFYDHASPFICVVRTLVAEGGLHDHGASSMGCASAHGSHDLSRASPNGLGLFHGDGVFCSAALG